MEALVDVGDNVVRVVINFVVNPSEWSLEQLSDSEYKKLCPKGFWIISDASPPNPALSTLLSTAATAFVGFSDLPGSAVAQTTGYYNSGQIILDSFIGWGEVLQTAIANPNGSKDVGVRYTYPIYGLLL